MEDQNQKENVDTPISMVDVIDSYISLIPRAQEISQNEISRRACEFLIAAARCSAWRRDFEGELVKANSLEKVAYASCIAMANGKNVTESKVIAEANPAYYSKREDVERLEVTVTYLKTHHEIFMNAHVFYRQLLKGDPLNG